MTLRDKILWQPSRRMQAAILIGAVVLVLGVGYLHTLTGLAFEFHVFFILPVLLVSWLIGTWAGLGMALLAVVVWIVADLQLAGDQADSLALVFNSGMRLAIFSYGAWLVGGMCRVLRRESRLAREDALTELPNRREFHDLGRRAFAQAQRQGTPFTAVFIDLDRFKEVNDSLGHKAGDQVLVSVAQVIRQQLRASDVSGRLGGDEFALLLPGMDAADSATYVESLRHRLLAAMREHKWPVTFSIGVASHPVTPNDFDGLLAQADALMYKVKNGGRDRVLQQTFASPKI